jgi:hypothetical protein
MVDLTQASRDKAKSQSFAAIGIPVGSVLVFKKDPAVTVKTMDDKNKVEYQGKPYSISTLAKQLVGSPVSGYLYFKFEGRVLKDLAESGVKLATSKPAEVPEPFDASTGSEVASKSEQGVDPLAGGIEAFVTESIDNEDEV